MKSKALLGVTLLAVLSLASWAGLRLRWSPAQASSEAVPTARVKRGDVTVVVTAKGELQGGNSEMLTAPMTGGSDMAITFLRGSGDLVKAGEEVARFDTTEQEFKLKEAEADLAEAEQQLVRAKAENDAAGEEARYSLTGAKTEITLAELEVRRNPLVSSITAQQNNLALEAARDTLSQIQHDMANRQATSAAAIAIQEAARNKARVQAEMARRNIENMTLRAKSTGYVNVQQNTGGNMYFYGMVLPQLQVGDTVRAGMAVAQIPDLKDWEIVASINELDRGHISTGQKAGVAIAALPGKLFTGKVKAVGGTTGPPWDRRFDCRLTLDNPSPELRPGMSTIIKIVTGVVPNGLWVPSQAVFESDGRSFVYLVAPTGVFRRDVTLVRRSESQVVIAGVNEGQLVSLASPEQIAAGKTARSGGALKALKQ
ncbi:MAG: efflux RND transporter periplasmic adaptor subunit [Acidobacteria bacterium]|nr:efflux RND transporter periplasmic adaptor subunit [Acidobacteriota bacterium]